MSIIRFVGRTMLASYFIANGAKSIVSPEPLVADARPLIDKAIPTIKGLVPAEYADKIPTDPKDLVRLNGAVQALGGLALFTGLGRRFGAGLIALSMLPHVTASKPLEGATAEEKKANRNNTMRNVALLGGALIASQDTAGKPGLTWRAEDATNRLLNAAEKQRRAIAKDAAHVAKDASKSVEDLQKRLSDMLDV